MEKHSTGLSRILSATQRKVLFLLFYSRNHVSNSSVLGECDVIVSLTSYGQRLKTVHATIESIASGKVKPSQLLLWVDNEEEKQKALMRKGLRRLVRRGLQIRTFKAIGPHSKYYPVVADHPKHHRPLVTADDDILYGKNWLADLVAANAQDGNVIHCYRAHTMVVDSQGIPAPYRSWELCASDFPSHATFLTGVSGVIYPPQFLDYLRSQGEAFADLAPSADDVWLNSRAVLMGIRVRQLHPESRMFPTIVGSQVQALRRLNAPQASTNEHARTKNDDQIQACYGASSMAKVARDLDSR